MLCEIAGVSRTGYYNGSIRQIKELKRNYKTKDYGSRCPESETAGITLRRKVFGDKGCTLKRISLMEY
jgi:hypothetical protein